MVFPPLLDLPSDSQASNNKLQIRGKFWAFLIYALTFFQFRTARKRRKSEKTEKKRQQGEIKMCEAFFFHIFSAGYSNINNTREDSRVVVVLECVRVSKMRRKKNFFTFSSRRCKNTQKLENVHRPQIVASWSGSSSGDKTFEEEFVKSELVFMIYCDEEFESFGCKFGEMWKKICASVVKWFSSLKVQFASRTTTFLSFNFFASKPLTHTLLAKAKGLLCITHFEHLIPFFLYLTH